MTFCLNCVMSPRESGTICSCGEFLAALPGRNIFRIGLAAVPRRLSMNHINEAWWLHFAGLATKQAIDSLGLTDSHVTAFSFPSVETMAWFLKHSRMLLVLNHTSK